jgi:Ca2+/H+ antiporter, TMEM165/GDT1 family
VTFTLTLLAAAVAVAIEMLEALAIVLAVGVERGFRNALVGAAAAVVAVGALCAVLGPALLSTADLGALQVVVGTLLLLFGLEWLRKGILRLSGRKSSHTAYEDFVAERTAMRGEPLPVGSDWAARTVAFKGVFLEGVEVALIVVALAGAPGGLMPALAGAGVALVAVIAIGVVLHRPLVRLPETHLKLGVGIALSAFGVFFVAEGLGVEWPLGDVALLYVAATLAVVARIAILSGRASAAEAGA